VSRPTGRLAAFLTAGSWIDGRLLLLAAVAVYLAVIAIGRTLLNVDLWPSLGVPSGPSLFFDARNVTAAAECRRLGYDPLVDNPCDPRGRAMFYPRVWLLLRFLGLDQSHTDLFGVLLGLGLLGVLWFLVGRVTVGAGVVLTLAVCSPSVMFAVERANMDVALLSLVGVAALGWRRGTGPDALVSPILVLLAAVAKLYPVFGLAAYLVSGSRKAALAAVGCGVVFVVYAIATLGDIAVVVRTAIQGQHHAFGARILLSRAYQLVAGQPLGAGSALTQLLALLALGVAAMAVFAAFRRRSTPAPQLEPVTSTMLAWWLGTVIFVGSFAISNSFDYRLVFLLLTLPQLLRWASGQDAQQRLASATLLSVILLLWIGALSMPLRLADELVTWATVGLFVALSAQVLPPLRLLPAGRVARAGTERA